jgi:hypothetical protein
MTRLKHIEIDGKRYVWREVLQLRREQWKAHARAEQPTLFELMDDSRPLPTARLPDDTRSPRSACRSTVIFRHPNAEWPISLTPRRRRSRRRCRSHVPYRRSPSSWRSLRCGVEDDFADTARRNEINNCKQAPSTIRKDTPRATSVTPNCEHPSPASASFKRMAAPLKIIANEDKIQNRAGYLYIGKKGFVHEDG